MYTMLHDHTKILSAAFDLAPHSKTTTFCLGFCLHPSSMPYSQQPTCLPFPSAQCEYLSWIRSAGNVSFSFFLWRGNWGRGIGLAVTEQTCTVPKQTLQSPNSSCSHQTAPSLFNDLKINIYYHF